MDFLHEYALLFAVATPVVVLVAIQVYLFACGERGTLLLPSLRGFPRIDIGPEVEEEVLTDVSPADAGAAAKFAANDGHKEAA